MKREDIEFRRNCQFYYNKINNLLKVGKEKEASNLLKEIENILGELEDGLRSTRFKVNLLRGIYVDLTKKGRIYKTSRRQTDE